MTVKILCVGAGGSGMAAIVRWHLALHDAVFVADDMVPADTLVAQYPGAEIWDVDKNVVPDRMVFSDAIPATHPFRAYAEQHNIHETSFPEELGILCEGRRVIAVTGTHGKSTTTALLSWVLAAAGRDPLCFIGAEILSWNGNFRWGAGPVVVEADEYRKHFLALHPETVVVTSLEMDHFDTYPDEQSLLQTFVEFCSQPSVRRVFVARGTPMLEDVTEKFNAIRNYRGPASIIFSNSGSRSVSRPGLDNLNFATVRFGGRGNFVSIDTVWYENGNCVVSLELNPLVILSEEGIYASGSSSVDPRLREDDGKKVVSETLTYPATTCSHLSNLAGVVAVLLSENVPWDKIKEGIATFPGIKRRLEHVGSLGRAQIYSDYAHHPTAVAETLAVCRKIWPSARIGVLFEPHERLRTSTLCGGYAGAFTSADSVGLLPVYDPIGRERKDITDAACRIAANNIVQISDYDAGFAWVQKFAKDYGDTDAVIIVMGAGPIDGQIRKRMTSAQL